MPLSDGNLVDTGLPTDKNADGISRNLHSELMPVETASYWLAPVELTPAMIDAGYPADSAEAGWTAMRLKHSVTADKEHAKGYLFVQADDVGVFHATMDRAEAAGLPNAYTKEIVPLYDLRCLSVKSTADDKKYTQADMETYGIMVRNAAIDRISCEFGPHAPTKRWPFVESPGEFTARLAHALKWFPLLGAVRHVLIENPPELQLLPTSDETSA